MLMRVHREADADVRVDRGADADVCGCIFPSSAH